VHYTVVPRGLRLHFVLVLTIGGDIDNQQNDNDNCDAQNHSQSYRRRLIYIGTTLDDTVSRCYQTNQC